MRTASCRASFRSLWFPFPACLVGIVSALTTFVPILSETLADCALAALAALGAPLAATILLLNLIQVFGHGRLPSLER